VISEKKFLLTGSKIEMDSYLEKWRKITVNRVYEAFELVKETEMEKFSEKSYFYRKINDLSLIDSDDNPDLVGDDIYVHNFEESEEEEDIGALEVEGLLL
jgi:hypothetical protein